MQKFERYPKRGSAGHELKLRYYIEFQKLRELNLQDYDEPNALRLPVGTKQTSLCRSPSDF